MKPILECIPNFSEGRNQATLAAIAEAIQSIAGVALLHQDISAGANRTVMTFAGAPEAVVEAAFRAIQVASERIDMGTQQGVHPRIGAVDVCPLVPLHGLSMEDAAGFAARLGQRVGEELQLPVYGYEENASAAHRTYLPQIRRGQYEGLAQKMQLPQWQPDYGPAEFNPRFGAMVSGARRLLVAYNVSLSGMDASAVADLAAALRSTGNSGASLTDGQKPRGRFPALRAIGWYQPDYETAQLSMNLIDYRQTSPCQVFQEIEKRAQQAGAQIVGSELIGLMPAACLLEAAGVARVSDLKVSEKMQAYRQGIKTMKLDRLRPFDASMQILEEALYRGGLLPVGTVPDGI